MFQELRVGEGGIYDHDYTPRRTEGGRVEEEVRTEMSVSTIERLNSLSWFETRVKRPRPTRPLVSDSREVSL